jgi:hypothetical protein
VTVPVPRLQRYGGAAKVWGVMGRGGRLLKVRWAVPGMLLLVAGCGGLDTTLEGAGSGDGAATEAVSPGPNPDATTADSDAADAADAAAAVAELPWSAERIARDLDLITALGVAHDAAWSAGVASGTAFLATHAWPQGYTAEAIQRCRLGDPPPDLRALDAVGFGISLALGDAVPAPDWRFPPTDELLADLGLRVYRVTHTEVVREFDTEPSVRSWTAHVAVDDDDHVVSFPICTPYLPGGRPDVMRELDQAFADLGMLSLMMTCDTYLAAGAEAVLEMFFEEGWDLTLVELRTGFHTWCAWHWKATDETGRR